MINKIGIKRVLPHSSGVKQFANARPPTTADTTQQEMYISEKAKTAL
jgi:hypothetical protein